MRPCRTLESWGRFPEATQQATTLFWSSDSPPVPASPGTVLAYGLGRSYGDVCLNDGGTLLLTERMDRFLSFDRETGVLRCEAGVSLDQILRLIVPAGWFLPVTPGTKFVTIAGAIANDVHGKNHNNAGTIGRYITQFELLRSDGSRQICSPTQNRDLFAATIGGLGLTGFITWAECKLIPIKNAFIQEESIQCSNLDEMVQLFAESDLSYQYTVAWIDCLAKGKQLGRGIFTRGNHCA